MENKTVMSFSLMQQEPVNLLPAGGRATLYPSFFSPAESDHYLEALQKNIDWRQEAIILFGKPVMQPRLTAWYGEEGKRYRYSGITMLPLPWTKTLFTIKEKVQQYTGYPFNSALLNLYRNGNDSMGWHRDNEKELGKGPVIASLSLGAARVFQFRNHKERKPVIPVLLERGSLLVMSGTTQTYWQHRLPKTTKATGIRLNITFRNIQS